MKTLSTALAAALLALLLALPGCGDTTQAVNPLADVIKSAATSTDPADCTRLFTRRFLQQNGSAGEPVQACERDAKDAADDPKAVTVSNVTIDGATAHADVMFRGGEYDGQQLRLRLVEHAGHWKLDRFIGFVRFDRAALLHAMKRTFMTAPRAMPEQQAACMVRGLAKQRDAKLKAIVIQGSSPAMMDVVLEAAEDCF